MNQQQFLQECGKSYPEAMAALGFFRQSVLQSCKTVIHKRISDLGEVLCISDQDLKLLEHARPDKPMSAVPDQVELGWKAKRSEDLYLYFYLCWLREPDEGYAPIGVAIAIYIKDRNKRENLAAKLDQLSEHPPFDGEPWLYSSDSDVIEFWMEVKEDELPQVGDKLDQLFVYTTEFLKALKGIGKHFRV
jgi:hypothetical protein